MNGRYNMNGYTMSDYEMDGYEETQSSADDVMANLMSQLMRAQNVARMWHWKVKSFALHMALGELYDGLSDMMDDLMEMYMGRYGTEAHIELSEPNSFSETDPLAFIKQLDDFLSSQESRIPQDGFLVNKYQEIQGMVSKIRYKMENLS